MVHDGVQGIKRAGLDDDVIAGPVAERDPLFAVVSLARPAYVRRTAAPGGIHMVEPEGGGPGAYRRVDEQAGILPAKVVGDGKKGHEMGADAVSGLVPLEIGHLVLLHQVGAAFFEPLVILGAGKVEPRGVRRENAFVLGMLNPLFRAEIPS